MSRLYIDDDDLAAERQNVRMKQAWIKARVAGFIRLVEQAADKEGVGLNERIKMLLLAKPYSKKKAKDAGTLLTDKDLQPFDDIIKHYMKKLKKEQEDAKRLTPPPGGWDTRGELSPELKDKLSANWNIPRKVMVGGRKRKRKTRRKKRRKSRKKRKTRRKKKRKKRKTKRR